MNPLVCQHSNITFLKLWYLEFVCVRLKIEPRVCFCIKVIGKHRSN